MVAGFANSEAPASCGEGEVKNKVSLTEVTMDGVTYKKGDTELLREAVVALRNRVHAPADRTCCPDCADDADVVDLITKLQERLLGE